MFPVEYLLAENVIVVRKKEHFNSLYETEHHFPPILTMQVWNNDPFSSLSVIGMWYDVLCILFCMMWCVGVVSVHMRFCYCVC